MRKSAVGILLIVMCLLITPVFASSGNKGKIDTTTFISKCNEAIAHLETEQAAASYENICTAYIEGVTIGTQLMRARYSPEIERPELSCFSDDRIIGNKKFLTAVIQIINRELAAHPEMATEAAYPHIIFYHAEDICQQYQAMK